MFSSILILLNTFLDCGADLTCDEDEAGYDLVGADGFENTGDLGFGGGLDNHPVNYIAHITLVYALYLYYMIYI